MKQKTSHIRKRTKRHRHSTLVYLDDEKLRITFFSLIIRVSSINSTHGTLKDFVRENRLHGVTNGKLLILSEMISPGSYLIELSRKLLPKKGTKERIDFVMVQEQLVQGVGGRVSELVDEEIPECKDIPWLGSKITLNGNYVWIKQVRKSS
jgi:hypothetical protein